MVVALMRRDSWDKPESNVTDIRSAVPELDGRLFDLCVLCATNLSKGYAHVSSIELGRIIPKCRRLRRRVIERGALPR